MWIVLFSLLDVLKMFYLPFLIHKNCKIRNNVARFERILYITHFSKSAFVYICVYEKYRFYMIVRHIMLTVNAYQWKLLKKLHTNDYLISGMPKWGVFERVFEEAQRGIACPYHRRDNECSSDINMYRYYKHIYVHSYKQIKYLRETI